MPEPVNNWKGTGLKKSNDALGDFAKLPDQLNEAREAIGKPKIAFKKKEEVPDDKPQQLSLF